LAKPSNPVKRAWKKLEIVRNGRAADSGWHLDISAVALKLCSNFSNVHCFFVFLAPRGVIYGKHERG